MRTTKTIITRKNNYSKNIIEETNKNELETATSKRSEDGR